MSCSRNKNNNERNMHSQMKLCSYKLNIHPSNWHIENMVSNVVDRMQGIQQHASVCTCMRSNPFSTLSKVKTRSKSNWRRTSTSAS